MAAKIRTYPYDVYVEKRSAATGELIRSDSRTAAHELVRGTSLAAVKATQRLKHPHTAKIRKLIFVFRKY